MMLRLSHADSVFWLLPPLMVLLTIGTVAQRWMGLHAAHQMFFSSFIVWWGPLPLPGGFTLLALLSFFLVLKFLLKSEWHFEKSGIIITHLSVLVLLVGGLLTAITARESFMIIPEGQETPFIYDYNARSLVVYENGQPLAQLDFARIAQWDNHPLPFGLEILDSCQNCAIAEPKTAQENARGMARFMELSEKKSEMEPEANLSGATLVLSNIAPEIDGRYIIFDGMPKAIEFSKDGRPYALIFGKNQTQLPFSVKLIDFQKQTYGGTETAKSYASDIVIKDGALDWPVRIEMNVPLRYRGYTFFQSSFEQGPDFETTILAVVENKGWLFPYIGTFGLALGLLLHIFIALRAGKRS